MSLTAAAIDAARAEGRAALIIYLPVGYPTLELSVEAAKRAVAAGADVIELGLPYSDPGMDGPVIEAAAGRALAQGTRTRDVLAAVSEVAATGAPTLVMTYYNPVFRYGVDRFAADLAAAGGAGLITADLIPDEAGDWVAAADGHDLDKVFVVAPSSTDARLAMTAAAGRGFVYAASTMGVTGTRASVGVAAHSLVTRLRDAGAERVCVGLGVSTGAQAAEVARYADGVIVGSAVVKALSSSPDPQTALEALSTIVGELAAGVGASR
ncbi:tryptophan synthase subunit alpha [Pseudactinotalea sp. HY160]|uniref:tryptophan synthase subunit alpha n=1 Tax=Pseudactinotalea sp. HY160 TaxID=2654490 RepID=UPI00128C670C|nr:tryptophan synthase subunit alpha [Pseudactinotalea sp. HY160]MPV49925.1 tryptophan synthase subunit alpha [Pseudactinotalea sp. HY160]